MKALVLSAILIAIVTSTACRSDSAPCAFDIAAFQVLDRNVGTGADATFGRTVFVHYTGWLYSPTAAGNKGTQFDSSRGREPYDFVLGTGNAIQGWHQGILGMRVGGTRTLLIPSSLAYGPAGRGAIPPNSALVFDVELVDVQ